MTVKSFKGGAHPPERKERSSGIPIEVVHDVKQVVLPVNQHLGAPLKVLVAVGDKVVRGQKIADGDGRMTVPLHASVSGTVKKIEQALQSNNNEGPCVFIEAEGSQADADSAFMPPLDGFACSKQDALARVREGGIVGMGGAGFPTHVKLAPTKPIDYVIANGAECEPYLTIDERMMTERPGDVVEGLALIMHLVGAPKGVLAVEDNKVHVVAGLQQAVAERGHGLAIEVQLLKTKYPQGGEKMLIEAVTGKQVPSGGLPMDVGCVVENVGTIVALLEAFTLGKPLIERGFTVTGGACASPKNLFAPIGTLVSDLAAAGVIKIDDDNLGRVLFGGPMMGVSVPNYAIPVQKNTSGITFMSKDEAKFFEETPCIRCGRCVRACSCRLSPALLNSAIKANDLAEAQKIGLLDCIECGTCSFVCPAHQKLVQRFRVAKLALRAQMQKAKEAQNAGK